MFFRPRILPALVMTLAGAVPHVISAQITDASRVPLQTAMTELFRFREAYAANYNLKDVAAVSAAYDTSAVVILADGTMLKGRTAINKSLADAASLPHLVMASDSVRVFGNTAIDVGTVTMHPSGAPEIVTKYVVVLRRGYNDWKVMYASQTPVAK